MGSEHPQESRQTDPDRQRRESSGGDSRSGDGSGADGVSNEQRGRGHVSGEASQVSVDDLFELLAHPGNRYALAYLVRTDGVVPLDELVESVIERGGTPDGITTADFRDQIATRLVHSNLPKLDDAGLADYDASEKTVRSTEATAVAVPYLELAMEQFSPD
ncbi:DUF7344 domain-containing protein [Halosimplex salinum]|uniref:DUF7344 domain-containing protein n=1 Tax=Halosimplex salinum TaxID=1710538 RepID=UPI000F488DC5|nr:hypothetical protein [Halosimplex salinum]